MAPVSYNNMIDVRLSEAHQKPLMASLDGSTQDLLNTKVIVQIVGTAHSKEELLQAINDSLQIIRKRHPGSNIRYIGMSMEDQLAVVSKGTFIMTTIIGAVAAIALVGGGIGVINIAWWQ